MMVFFVRLLAPFCKISTTILVRQSSHQRTERRFASLWAVLVPKLQEIFPDRHAKGTFIVLSLDVRAQILSISDRRNRDGKPVFQTCTTWTRPVVWYHVLLICVNPVFLMLCYDKLSVRQALQLRIARPICDGRPFASSPFRPPGESRPLFSRFPCVVACPICDLSVSMPDPTRPSALWKGKCSNPVHSSVRHFVLLLVYRPMAWPMSIHIDAHTTPWRTQSGLLQDPTFRLYHMLADGTHVPDVAINSFRRTCSTWWSALLHTRHPSSQEEPFRSSRKSGLLFMLIRDMEKPWQCQSPRQLQRYVATSTKKNENLMGRDIGTQWNQYWKEDLNVTEQEISVMKRGYKRSLKAVQRKEWNTATTKIDSCEIYERFRDTLVVFQSNQNWWVIYLILVVERNTSFTASDSLSNTNESFSTRPGRGDRKQRFHISTEGTLRNSLDIYPKCRILGTIIKSAGSRIGILAHEVLCNHDLRYDTRRLHWLCYFSRRRSSTFRTTWDAEAGTQGNVILWK